METVPPPKDVPTKPAELAAQAAVVLEDNDMGGWTRPAPNLYPHQWSWDSAFIAIGEYYEPFSGGRLGSDRQSWTAAVALDWLADQEGVSEKP